MALGYGDDLPSSNTGSPRGFTDHFTSDYLYDNFLLENLTEALNSDAEKRMILMEKTKRSPEDFAAWFMRYTENKREMQAAQNAVAAAKTSDVFTCVLGVIFWLVIISSLIGVIGSLFS